MIVLAGDVTDMETVLDFIRSTVSIRESAESDSLEVEVVIAQ